MDGTGLPDPSKLQVPPPARRPRPIPDRILLPLIVATALFMENLDSTVLATALPAIGRDFGVSPIQLKVALTSYLLAVACALPASGWLADRLGARLVFRLALVLFMTGSILCGLSGSIPEMVAARVVQGIGGAMMVPVGRLVVLRSVAKSELVGALAWLTIPALVGPALGPLIGGFITTYFDWRWIFWINIPIGVLGLVAASLFMPELRGETRVSFDPIGFLMSGMGLAAFVTGSMTLGSGLLPWSIEALLFGIGGAFLVAYWLHSRRRRDPILDLTLFRVKTYRAAMIGAVLFRAGVGATPFLLPLMLQLAFGMNAFHSGIITFASAFGAMTMKVVAIPVLRRFGFRTVLIVNAVVAGVFIALPAAFTPQTPATVIFAALLIGGFFRSLQFTSFNTLAFAEIEPARMSRATTLLSVLQQISMGLGISFGALALELSVAGSGTVTTGDFAGAFLLVGGLAVASMFAVIGLPPDAGGEISGHRRRSGGGTT